MPNYDVKKNIRQGSFYFNLAPISNLSINTIILLMIDYSVTKAQVFCNICKYFFYHMGVKSKYGIEDCKGLYLCILLIK